MPYTDKEQLRKFQREYRVKHKTELAAKAAKKRSANRIEGRFCVCSKPCVRVIAGQPWCQDCIDKDKKQKEWSDELKYGVNGRVEAARPTRKHYYQKREELDKAYDS